jgi:hypothetical protein
MRLITLLSFTLAPVIAKTVIINDLKSYEDACLDSIVGEDVTVLVPPNLYHEHNRELLVSIPKENECKIIRSGNDSKSYDLPTVTVKGKKYYKITFETVDWGPMDASDLVEAKRREAEKAKQEVSAEGYYGWYLDIFNKNILPNVAKDTSNVVNGLKKLNSGLKPWRLDEHKKTYVIQGLGIVKIAYPKNSDIQNLIDSISKKLNVEKEVKSFDVGKISF